jgi:predicted ArsR family transcriptional regulator
MPVTTARQRVLAYLQKQRAASAAQIGRALDMSAANVRHHLSVMLGDGRVVLVGLARKEGRGRPVKQYGLSEKSLGNNLAFLSDAVLDHWPGILSPAQRERAMLMLAKELVEQMGRPDKDVPVAKQLALLVEKLDKMHYQARWEAGGEGPRILFAHCPYAAIVEKHPELCRMDALMLGEEMDAKVRQLAKIDQKQGGSGHCIFLTHR